MPHAAPQAAAPPPTLARTHVDLKVGGAGALGALVGGHCGVAPAPKPKGPLVAVAKVVVALAPTCGSHVWGQPGMWGAVWQQRRAGPLPTPALQSPLASLPASHRCSQGGTILCPLRRRRRHPSRGGRRSRAWTAPSRARAGMWAMAWWRGGCPCCPVYMGAALMHTSSHFRLCNRCCNTCRQARRGVRHRTLGSPEPQLRKPASQSGLWGQV